MSLWRRTAIEKFPKLRRDIAEAEGPQWMWYELRQALEKAYFHDPLDEQFVSDVYDYASWCLHHRSIDIRTAVVLWFYEHLPNDTLIRNDIARWLSQEDFDTLAFAWEYALKEKTTAFQEEFAMRKAVMQGIASRSQRSALKQIEAAQRVAVYQNSVHTRRP